MTGNSQHPNYDVALGEQLIYDVYDAFRTGPAWTSTLPVVTLWETPTPRPTYSGTFSSSMCRASRFRHVRPRRCGQAPITCPTSGRRQPTGNWTVPPAQAPSSGTGTVSGAAGYH